MTKTCKLDTCGRSFTPKVVNGVAIHWQEYCCKEHGVAARNKRARARLRAAKEGATHAA